MTDARRTVSSTTAPSRPRGGRRAAARPALPWRGWVEALAGRYRRRPARPAIAERVLARLRSRVRERWLLASRTLLPQIHLAIQPVLRPRLWPARPAPPTSRQGIAAKARRTARQPSATPARPPLQRVFERRRESARALHTVPAARREPGAVTRPLGTASPGRLERGSVTSTQVARRLAGRSQRVEQVTGAEAARVLARREPPAAASAVADPAAAFRGPRAVQARWNEPPSRFPTAPQPTVDVDAFADRVMRQIDHRLHAWRERTGL